MLKFMENLYEVRKLRKNVCYTKNSVMYFKWAFPTANGDFNLTYAEKVNKSALKEISSETQYYKTILVSSLPGLDKKYPEDLELKEETIVYGLERHQPFPIDNSLSVKIVKNKEDLLLWSKVTAQIYSKYDADFIFESFKTDLRRKYANYFIFYKNAEPIGVSQVIRGAGYSGVYWVGILPKHRKHGYGTELTKQTLNYEIKHKHHRFLLAASELGLIIYKKLGFKPLEKLYEYNLRNRP